MLQAAPVAKQAAAPATAAGDKGGEGKTEAEEAELEDLISTLENENEKLEIMMWVFY